VKGNVPDVSGDLPDPTGTNTKQPSLEEVLNGLFPPGGTN